MSDRGGSGSPWQHLAMTREGPPLLFAGGIDGTVALFDLRQHDDTAAARVHLHDGPMVRCVNVSESALHAAQLTQAGMHACIQHV